MPQKPTGYVAQDTMFTKSLVIQRLPPMPPALRLPPPLAPPNRRRASSPEAGKPCRRNPCQNNAFEDEDDDEDEDESPKSVSFGKAGLN